MFAHLLRHFSIEHIYLGWCSRNVAVIVVSWGSLSAYMRWIKGDIHLALSPVPINPSDMVAKIQWNHTQITKSISSAQLSCKKSRVKLVSWNGESHSLSIALGSWQHILSIYARVGCPIIERFLFLLFGLFPVAGSRLRTLRGVVWIWMHVRDV